MATVTAPFVLTDPTWPWVECLGVFNSIDFDQTTILAGQTVNNPDPFVFFNIFYPNELMVATLFYHDSVDHTLFDGNGNTWTQIASIHGMSADSPAVPFGMQMFYAFANATGVTALQTDAPADSFTTIGVEAFTNTNGFSFDVAGTASDTTGNPTVTVTTGADTPISTAAFASVMNSPSYSTTAGGVFTLGFNDTLAEGNFIWATVSEYNLVLVPQLFITADNISKPVDTLYTFAGNEFQESGLLTGDTISSVAFACDGAAIDAPVGDYPIVPSDAMGTGLDKYTITYINGDMNVFMPQPGCSTVAFPLPGPWYTADGNPLSNGTLTLKLSFDCSTPCADLQIAGNKFSTILLDGDGTVIGSPAVWPNNIISPANSYYIVNAYNENGKLVAIRTFTVTGGGPS